MLSRVFLSLGVVCGLLVSSVFGQGNGGFPQPQLYCSPVTVDAFAVALSGTSPGSLFANVTGGFGTYFYFVPLATPYLNSNVFFDVILTANQSANMYNSLVTFGFTIQLNGQTKFSSGNNPFFDATGTGVVPSISFNNWRFDSLQRFAINNTLIVNVTESIINQQNPPSVNPDQYRCNTTYIFVFQNGLGSTSSAGFVTGDPQFKGLRGQSFQVHGVDGAVYNLISDANMQLNSRFTFLEGPRPCPVMPSTGKVSGACWSHPGSYLSELALKTSGGSQVFIGSGEASQGFASVQLNGKNVPVGSTLPLSFTDSEMTGSITLDNSHEMTIRSGLFEVVIENNDGFINLRSVYVSAANWPKLASHGLLGQTWQNKRYGGKIKEIEGDVDDYLIEDDNMFGDNFLFNKFISA